MKKSIQRITRIALLVLIATVFVVACAQKGLSEGERLDRFIDDANADPRDYEALQSNFSSRADDYDSLNTPTYWNLSYFAASDQPFSVTNESSGGAHSEFSGSTQITGTVTSANVSGGSDVTFVFVENPDSGIKDGHLIRAIFVGPSGSVEEIRSLAPTEPGEDESESWILR